MSKPNEQVNLFVECATMEDMERKRCEECTVLEEEFRHLHDEASYSPSSNDLDKREKELRERIHALERKGNEPRTALCLSGGGIRSATFSLGVLQGLAQKGLLEQFHYLSTVSGGGYIGSWLSSWIHHSNGNLTPVQQALAGKQEKASPEPEQVHRLRAYSNYLSPVWGLSIDFLTLVATFLRNLALYWLVFIPFLAVVLMLPRIYLSVLTWKAAANLSVYWPLSLAAILIITGIAYTVSDLPDTVRKEKKLSNQFILFCFTPILCAAILLSWLGVWYGTFLAGWPWYKFCAGGVAIHVVGLAFGVIARLMRGLHLWGLDPKERTLLKLILWDAVCVALSGSAAGLMLYFIVSYVTANTSASAEAMSNFRDLYAALSVPFLLGCYWVGGTVYQGWARRITTEDDREWWSRSGAWWLGAGVAWVIGFVLVIYGPWWVLNTPWFAHSAGPETLGIGGGILGILTGLIGYWSKNGATLKQRAKGIAAATGLRLLDLAAIVFTIILLLTVSYVVSYGLYGTAKFVDLNKEYLQPWADVSPESKFVTDYDNRFAESGQGAAKPKQTVTPEEAAKATESAAKATESAAKAAKAAVEATDSEIKAGLSLVGSKEALEKSVTASSKAAESAAHVSEVLAALVQQPNAKESKQSSTYLYILNNEPNRLVLILFGILFVIGIVMSFAIGINTFSMHSMYGNRLVRAYLGATRKKRNPHWFTGFDPEDNVSMKDLDNSQKRLFHVVNMALNMVKPSDGHLEWQQRKAASFTVSPLYSGSASVGYQPTESYSRKGEGVSLGRAMTISGAAASPNMGYNTSTVVAFVMTFFNIRLGWWLPNPGPKWRSVWTRSEPRIGIKTLLAEALAKTTDNTPYVCLSDGGHFENLALYEMVKRRCHRIVVVDAGCDPKYGFEDLENAIRKIRIDLGISIVFPEGLPTPEKVRASGRHIATGIICYSDVDGQVEDGHIVYIKPVLSGDEPLDVMRYGAANKDPKSPFPHQSTADQFFDESQFESYRMLGYHSVITGFPTHGGWSVHGQLSDKVADQNSDSAEPKTDTRTSEAGGGMMSGVSNALQSLGQGAVLATAITVGGVIGVAGTLTLQPGAEVGFTEQDRQLLKDGLTLKVSGLPEAVNAALSSGLTVTVNSPSVTDTTRIEKKLVLLEKYMLVSTPTNSELNMIRKEIHTIRMALVDEKGELKTGSIVTKLDGLQDRLGDINESVKKTDPRRNVRGVGEGGVR